MWWRIIEVCVYAGSSGQINIPGGILTLWATNLQHCSPSCSSCVLSPGPKFRGGHLERAEQNPVFPKSCWTPLKSRQRVCVCVYWGGIKKQWEEEICFSVSLFPPTETEPFTGGGPCHCFRRWQRQIEDRH